MGLSIVEHLAAAGDSTCQIHPGLGAQRRLPEGRGAGNRILQAPPRAKLDLGPMTPEEGPHE